MIMETAGIIALILSLIGGIAGYGSSVYNTRKANEANEKLAEQQNVANQQMLALTNQYNDPSSQMMRYAKAGLNPNLVYSQPNLSANSPEMVASLQPHQMPDVSSLSNGISQASSIASQISLQKAQVENLKADTSQKGAATNLTWSQFQHELVKSDLTKEQINQVRTDVTKMQNEIDLINSQAEVARAQVANIDSQTLLNKIDSATRHVLNSQQAAVWKSQAKLSAAQAEDLIKSFAYRMLNIQSQTDLNVAQRGLTQAQELVQNRTWKNLITDGMLLDLKFDNEKSYYDLINSLGGSEGAVKILAMFLRSFMAD